METISWCDSKCKPTQTLDEAVLNNNISDDNDRHTGPSVLCPEDKELINDSTISDNSVLLKQPCSISLNQDYFEKIKEFHLYVDMVKKFTKPGCSSEILNVALSSMTTLVETLCVVSSKQYTRSLL